MMNSVELLFSLRPKEKPEQLECLHSQNTPATPWLPMLLIHIWSLAFQIKTMMSKSIIRSLYTYSMWYNNQCYTRHTFSLGAISKPKMKNILCIKSDPYICWYSEVGQENYIQLSAVITRLKLTWCTLHYLIIIIVQTYLNTLNL